MLLLLRALEDGAAASWSIERFRLPRVCSPQGRLVFDQEKVELGEVQVFLLTLQKSSKTRALPPLFLQEPSNAELGRRHKGYDSIMSKKKE